MNLLVGIIILHAENCFFSFACKCLCWWAFGWTVLFHTAIQGSWSFILSQCPLRKVLLLSAKRNLNHHHIHILVCVTRAKTVGRWATFKKYMIWELHTTFHPLIPLARTQSHGHIYLPLKPGNVGCSTFKRKRSMSTERLPASAMWTILIFSSSIVC